MNKNNNNSLMDKKINDFNRKAIWYLVNSLKTFNPNG